MAVKLAQINLTNLLTGGLGRDNVAGSLFEPVQAAFVGAHLRIMRACGHRSSCSYRSSGSRTFADYPVDMTKAQSLKPIAHDEGQKSKTAGDAPYEERREDARFPKSLLEQLIFGKRARRVAGDLIVELVETCRNDFMPGMPLCEFFMYVLLVSKMLMLHERGREASASDLSRLTGIPRTTVLRKLETMLKEGAIERCGHRWILVPSFFNTPLVIKGFKRRQGIVSLAREKIATEGN